MRRPLLLLFDVAAVLAFVAIGRDTHDSGSGLGGVLETAIPFLIALAASWAFARAWKTPDWPRTGAAVAASTVILGMFLRNTWWGEGTAVTFVIVAAVFLGVTMVGWRLAAIQVNRWRFERRRALRRR